MVKIALEEQTFSVHTRHEPVQSPDSCQDTLAPSLLLKCSLRMLVSLPAHPGTVEEGRPQVDLQDAGCLEGKENQILQIRLSRKII